GERRARRRLRPRRGARDLGRRRGGSGAMSDWLMTYQGYDPRAEGLREALCTLGNGYVGTRGAAPESSADDVHYPGTYVAGVFNRLQSEVDGLTLENEDMVNAPNWLPLSFRPQDGEW